LNTLDEVRHTGAQFLIVDLEIALTFVRIAQTSDVPKTKARTRGKAAYVYAQVSNFARKARLPDHDAEMIDFLLRELRQSLESLGESV
jgi:hypothetical protein